MKRIAAVILAAGASTRMGLPKQLLPFRGRSLLRHAVQVALTSPCRPVLVIIGAEAHRMREELQGLDVLAAENASWREGIASSIRTAIEALVGLPEPPDAALFMLCDQPLVTSELLNCLVNTYQAGSHLAVGCDYGDTLGVPALFDRELFPELMNLRGNQGAKRVLQARAGRAAFVHFPDARIDIDTHEDYARLRRLDASSNDHSAADPSP